jgi:hypothetical protein
MGRHAVLPALLLILLASSLTALTLPLTARGIPLGVDGKLHVGNTVVCAELLTHKWPPWSWIPYVAGGYGGPNFLYYGYGSFVLPAWLINLGADPLTAIKLLLGFGFLVASLSAFWFCTSFGNKRAACIGVLLYTWNPYLLSLVYVRGAYPEFMALCAFPAFLTSALKYLTQGNLRFLGLSALIFVTILWIHTLSLIILGIGLSVCVAIAIIAKGLKPVAIARYVALVLLGLLSASYLLEAPMFQRKAVAIESQFESSDLYLKSGLPALALLNAKPIQQIASSYVVPGRVHIIAYVLSIFGVVFCCKSPNLVRWYSAFAISAAFFLLLSMQPLGAIVLTLLPPVRYLQFPLRFLGIFHTFATIGISLSLAALTLKHTIMLSCLVLSLCGIFYSPYLQREFSLAVDYSALSSIITSCTTLDHEAKYMPVGAIPPKAARSGPLLNFDDPRAKFQERSNSLNSYSYNILGNGGKCIFSQYWFPNWRLTVDGHEQIVSRDQETGLCTFNLMRGEHHVALEFVDTPCRQIAFLFSGVGLLTSCMLCCFPTRSKPSW